MCRHLHICHAKPDPCPDYGGDPDIGDGEEVEYCKVIFDRCDTARWGEDCGGSTVEEVIIQRHVCQWCCVGVRGRIMGDAFPRAARGKG